MNTTLYVATKNSDQTEGRGHTVIIGLFTEPDDAVQAVKGHGTMGASDAFVYTVDLVDGSYTGPMFKNLYYGYRQLNGVWGYGYTSEKSDPEYLEFLRLQEKFGTGKPVPEEPEEPTNQMCVVQVNDQYRYLHSSSELGTVKYGDSVKVESTHGGRWKGLVTQVISLEEFLEDNDELPVFHTVDLYPKD